MNLKEMLEKILYVLRGMTSCLYGVDVKDSEGEAIGELALTIETLLNHLKRVGLSEEGKVTEPTFKVTQESFCIDEPLELSNDGSFVASLASDDKFREYWCKEYDVCTTQLQQIQEKLNYEEVLLLRNYYCEKLCTWPKPVDDSISEIMFSYYKMQVYLRKYEAWHTRLQQLQKEGGHEVVK